MRFFCKFAIIALVGFAGLVPSARAETVNFTLLLTCDVYKVDNISERGGFARLNAAVKAERSKGGHVVYVHAGDLISPSLLSSFDMGEHTIALTNIAPPDMFIPGNHEFDFGTDIFMKRMSEAHFPKFAANMRARDGSALPGFRDSEVKDFNGVKVGFIGLAADDSPMKSKPGPDLSFAPTFETGVALAREMRATGVDLVVAVVHAKRETDLRLYSSGDFDIILSGDDHDLAVLYDGRKAFAEAMQEANYVVAIDVQATVKQRDGKRHIDWFPNFRIIDTATIPPDPGTQVLVDTYNAALSEQLDVPVGVTTEPLDSRNLTVRAGEAAIGNLIADAMRLSVNADATIINGGLIRGNTEYSADLELTRRDVLKELPFGNRTVKLQLRGSAIKEALENGVSDLPNASGRFPQVSGITFTASARKPKGQRVSDIKIDGKPLDAMTMYTLATTDYLFEGGDEYTALKQGKPLLGVRDAKLIANDVMAYIANRKSVSPRVEGRVNIRE